MARTELARIENFIRTGRVDVAEAELARFVSGSSLAATEKVAISIFYLWLGNIGKAIRVLGPVLSRAELRESSDETLYLQIRLGQLLAYQGCRYVAERIFESVESLAAIRRFALGRTFPQYHRSLADYHVNRDDFESAMRHFEKVCEYYPSESQEVRFAFIGLAECEEGLGRSWQAIRMLSEFIDGLSAGETLFRGIALQVRGAIHFRNGNFTEARSDFDCSLQSFSGATKTNDFAYALKWSGAINVVEGNRERALADLSTSLKNLKESGGQPMAIAQVIYWMEKLDEWVVPVGLRLSLRCHPCYSPYSLLVGSTRSISKLPLHPWIRSQIPSNLHDTWKITGKDIIPVIYQKSVSEEEKRTTMDLVSGMVRGRAETPELLTEMQSKLLIAVIGSGDLGIKYLALADFVYQNNLGTFESASERIHSLVKDLRKKDIVVERVQNAFRFNREGWVFFLPSDLRLKGKHVWLETRAHTFQRTDLMRWTGATDRTANRWIREWIQSGIVVREGCGRSARYTFMGSRKSSVT